MENLTLWQTAACHRAASCFISPLNQQPVYHDAGPFHSLDFVSVATTLHTHTYTRVKASCLLTAACKFLFVFQSTFVSVLFLFVLLGSLWTFSYISYELSAHLFMQVLAYQTCTHTHAYTDVTICGRVELAICQAYSAGDILICATSISGSSLHEAHTCVFMLLYISIIHTWNHSYALVSTWNTLHSA